MNVLSVCICIRTYIYKREKIFLCLQQIYIRCIGDTQPGKQKFKQMNAKKDIGIENNKKKLLQKTI